MHDLPLLTERTDCLNLMSLIEKNVSNFIHTCNFSLICEEYATIRLFQRTMQVKQIEYVSQCGRE